MHVIIHKPVTYQEGSLLFNAGKEKLLLNKSTIVPGEFAVITKSTVYRGRILTPVKNRLTIYYGEENKPAWKEINLSIPPDGEASFQILNTFDDRKIFVKARYGDAYPALEAGAATEPINLFVPMDVVIDADDGEKINMTLHYVSQPNQAGILLVAETVSYFLMITYHRTTI